MLSSGAECHREDAGDRASLPDNLADNTCVHVKNTETKTKMHVEGDTKDDEKEEVPRKEHREVNGAVYVYVEPMPRTDPTMKDAPGSAEVAHINLNSDERRGWWREHQPAHHEMAQVFVQGAVNDVELPLMLDTGANISIIHTNMVKLLDISVRIFQEDVQFFGVSEAPLAAYGKAALKVRLGPNVVYEVEMWVGDFEASTLIILGTDFMMKAGIRVDLMSKTCAMPSEQPIPMLTQAELKSEAYLEVNNEARDAALRSLRRDFSGVPAVATVGDTLPEIFSLDLRDPISVNQSKLAAEVYLHEGQEMSLDDMQSQLALIPELSSEPPSPVDMSTADIGEEENTPEEIEKLRSILEAEKDLFISSGNALPPPAQGVVCDVEVEEGKIVCERARRVPIHLLGKLYDLLKGLLRAGLIRHSDSQWASPIVIVLKKNGKDIRLCIDYRGVNLLTKLMRYCMPLIEDLLDSFHAVMWMCSLDNASGFWAIPLTKRARHITAFICPLGHFEWLRMPQGFKNSPQIYQRVIDNCLWATVRNLRSQGQPVHYVGMAPDEISVIEGKVVGEDLPTDVSLEQDVFHVAEAVPAHTKPVLYRRSYIDDINFGAGSWNELCEMLKSMLAAFRERGISISLSKSVFGKKSVEFLSHRITRKGIEAAPRNLDAVMKMPFPRSMKGVQKFLGSLNYYHRFINNFATYAGALYELTDARLRDGSQLDHARVAFKALKQKLCEAPLLRHMDRGRPVSVVLYTNAWAFGAAVCQEHDGLLHPVRFYSKVFQDNERGYMPAEREVLALLKTLDASLDLMAGQEITVYARFSTMKWLFSSKSLTGRAVQWGALLSPWTLKVVRSDRTPTELLAVLAASIAPPKMSKLCLMKSRR